MKHRFLPGNKAGQKHGFSPKGSKQPEYRCLSDMKARCQNPDHKFYSYYGGRGISVCQEWQTDFIAFYKYVGPRPSSSHTLDRFPDNDGNYEPGNVRWATRAQQVANRRTSRLVELNGERIPIGDACKRLGLERRMVIGRIERGQTPEQAISAPSRWAHPMRGKRKGNIG